MTIRRLVFVCLAFAFLCGAPAGAGAQTSAEVDLELVLLVDASGSIDDGEFELQRAGYAEALRHQEVLWAIAHGGQHGRIAVTFVEWANQRSQDIVVPWTIIAGEADATAFGRAILAAPRRAIGSNAIGAALLTGLSLIEGNAIEGWRKVIDLSADSLWNSSGPSIAEARDAVIGADIVINGLAVECRTCNGRPRPGNLEQDFATQVIGGPGAFVVTADGDASFAQAVRRKLILEIAGLEPDGDPDARRQDPPVARSTSGSGDRSRPPASAL
jgi:Protein of unknown function (DUF1194)